MIPTLLNEAPVVVFLLPCLDRTGLISLFMVFCFLPINLCLVCEQEVLQNNMDCRSKTPVNRRSLESQVMQSMSHNRGEPEIKEDGNLFLALLY
mmetsp:Transcript_23938/g.47605  ORF Transcript_23938/g.47605 Transcript_23938/m.47605 type:complete len:94 (-) Transcript_23938:5-286(-)